MSRGRHKKDCTCENCNARIKKQFEERFKTEPAAEPVAEPVTEPAAEPVTQPRDPEPVSNQKTDFFDDMLNDYNANTIEPEPIETPENEEIETPEKTTSTTKIKGATIILLIDLFIPPVISLIYNNFINKKKPITAQSLKLEQDEKEELIELADQAMEDSNIELSPMNAFLLGLSMIYGSKIFMND
jgi:hypothetical protein